MTIPFLDTNIIIRFLTGDDLAKQEAAARLFQAVEDGHLTVAAPDTVIADAVFVLNSPRLYHLPRHEIAGLLSTLVRLPGFRVTHRRVVLRALGIYGTTTLDFGDAMILSAMEHAGATEVYTFDADFDRPGIRRLEP